MNYLLNDSFYCLLSNSRPERNVFTRQQQIKKQLVIVCLSVKFHTPINKQSQADKGTS